MPVRRAATSGRASPEELRSAIEIHGTELFKQHLVSAQSGRYRDLPDIPEAMQAADGVAEIDSLVLAGNGLEAARRFRHLTGTIWDEVHAIVADWANTAEPRNDARPLAATVLRLPVSPRPVKVEKLPGAFCFPLSHVRESP